MSDSVGKPLFPGQLEEINDVIRTGFVNGLKETADFIKESDDGTAAQMIIGGVTSSGISSNVVTEISNKTAVRLIYSVIDTIVGSDPDKNYLAAAISDDGLLSVLVFHMDSGESEFFSTKIGPSEENFAAEIFRSIYIRKGLETLAKKYNAVVCWEVSEYFCEMKFV